LNTLLNWNQGKAVQCSIEERTGLNTLLNWNQGKA